ncbi:glycoside hydrolase family 32 protein [Lactobacillus kalixensis]|uniref:Sucrose-6-phosphate hydrolase n=1 Tax=Lactobacillus kalixensis DSM 16043 TaxID=1423763 RepID=A0A0R1U722_9LACO|nr:glycoside hydrolase family 32 protein [Lactobacillus kalixensis]KRL89009.1 sucrase [Lactobacillus kalixensis DSM 16043]
MKNIHKNILHIEPTHGLINDPNGLIYDHGKYFVFYQWNRFKLDHSYKEWGLTTSFDLIHWQSQGSALIPDTIKDKDGVYSGSAIPKDGKIHVFYTGNTKNNGNRKSYQIHAILEKENTFVKQPQTIETPSGYTEHFRDPFISKENDHWQMLVGAQTDNHHGTIAIFTSDDLKKWQYQGKYFENKILDQMCECPNLVTFKDKRLLLVCPQKRQINLDQDISSYSAYYIGKQENNRFIPDSKLTKLDEGFDFYSPQVFQDKSGRKIMLAWMSRMTDTQEEACPTKQFGYMHCLTLPRELILKNGKLYQQPLKEYLDASQTRKKIETKEIKFDSNLCFEIFHFNPSNNSKFEISLFNDNIQLEYKNKNLTFRRKDWSTSKFNTKTFQINEIYQIDFYCDRSAIEIFINNGEKVLSARYFCNENERKNIFLSSHNFKFEIKDLKI